jgi:arsenite methyltransferase
VRDFVRVRYDAVARHADADCGCHPDCCADKTPADAQAETSCCDTTCCGVGDPGYGEKIGYSDEDRAAVPTGADLALGCGNPLAIASIKPGETVLDLGSGAGFDCFLAAHQLAGTGHVIGVDMTAAMVSKARINAAQASYKNVEFRLGEIEVLPVADASVDLIISNCVINLSPEMPRVFREAFRVLKPGGRLAIADVVATQPLPARLREKLSALGACIAVAALVGDLRMMLAEAGFTGVEIAPREGSQALINQWTGDENAARFVVSALLKAVKP